MVKGISRQVIVVHPQDGKLFDQAIFILREDASENGISDDTLMQEANKLLHSRKKTSVRILQLAWAGMGGALVGVAWLITAFLF